MNILITGGAGFIGRTSHEKLYKSGNKITLLDKRDPFSVDLEVGTYIKADVCNQKKMRSVFETHQFDGVIHLAAVVVVNF